MAGAAGSTLRQQQGAFLFFPNRYVHESWRADLMPLPVWDVLAACRRTEGRLAGFVIERAGLGHASLAVFAGPQARFCQLPWPAVHKVSQRLGLALNGARLAKVLDAKLVNRVRNELGPAAYEFALRRAPLITMQTDPLAPDLAAEAPLIEQLERSGINYIGLALAEVDAALRARFKLKLPKGHASLLDAPQGNVAADAAWQVVRKMVREVEPEWSASLE